MSRPPRNLRRDELELWRYITRNVAPYNPQPRRGDDAAAPNLEPAEPTRAPAAPVPASPAGAKRPMPPLRLGATAAMDKRTGRRFKRGELAVDGRIDLHGLTVEQAHAALSRFIRASHARGARCVVVVTGKGSGAGTGKIRRETPEWLNRADLRPLVLAVSEARTRDGGTGALYVMLKRKRGD